MDVFETLKKQFKVKQVSVDNVIFKLFNKGSVLLCLTGALLCAATQYFGNPITCTFDDTVDKDLGERYCWIHGSNWIPKAYQEDFDCIASQDSNSDKSNVPTTSYYQWVIFFLLFQSILFALPYQLWKLCESGVIKAFVTPDAKSAFILGDEEKFTKLIKGYVKQFNCILNRNNRYFVTFMICEMLNVIVIYINFFLTDKFLNNKFKSYGFDVYEYFQIDPKLEDRPVNPMCDVFPTKVSCDVKLVSGVGSTNTRNGYCILAQNIVNEKVFLILFFWYIILFILSAFYIFYRLAVLAINELRVRKLSMLVHGDPDLYTIRNMLRKCGTADWFVLNQIGKNINPYLFGEFLHALSRQIGKSRATLRPEEDLLIQSKKAEEKEVLIDQSKNNIELKSCNPLDTV